MASNNGHKYGIDIKKEYRIYKSIGRKKGDFERYSHWKKYILDKYKGYQDQDYLEDIIRYLNQKMTKVKMSDEVYNVVMIPFFMFIFSILVVIPSVINTTNLISTIIYESIVFIALLFAVFLFIESYRSKRWANFFLDYIEILTKTKDALPSSS